MSTHNLPTPPPTPSDADRVAPRTAEDRLDAIDAAMIRFSATGDAATLVDEVADALTGREATA